MFTGIVQERGTVVTVAPGGLVIAAGTVLDGLELGASVAVNGVCLTVTRFDSRSFAVDIQPETLRRTNLGGLRAGDNVNLERALKFNGELGGHLVQGHIDDTGAVIDRQPEGPAVRLRFSAPPEVLRYIVPRGFIAVDGTSLTVTEKDDTSFGVSIIPFTQELSIISGRDVGDVVNIEADIIGKYVAAMVAPQENRGITADFLREHGFPVE